MSDFLTALVGRTLGTTPVLSPRRRSRYEPDSIDRRVASDERDEAAERATAGPLPSQHAPDVPPEDSRVTARMSPARVVPPPPSTRESRPVAAANSVPAAPLARDSSSTADHVVRSPERPGTVPAELLRRPGSHAVPAREPRAPLLRRDISPNARKDHRDIAPAIHVTIGRVEVRAVHRDEAKRPAPKSAGPPKLPLSDYLRQRRD